MNSLGIIGTALRGKDTDYDSILTKDLYLDQIYPKALEIVKELKVDTVISGGAAGIDHLAPLLYLHSVIPYISIYYPTKFTDTDSLIAKTIIKYHSNFSNIVFNNSNKSIRQLEYLRNIHLKERECFNEYYCYFEEEPISTKYEGFFSRNTKIANNSDYLLVFSYFDGDGNCLTNGSKDTITKFLSKNTEDKIIKVDIRDLI